MLLRSTQTPRYCAIGLYMAGEDAPRLGRVPGTYDNPGKVILFDTVKMAREFLPILGNGRIPSWSNDRETIAWTPIQADTFNRACIITKYDPYNLPAGMPPDLRSETPGKEWKRHIMFSAAFFDVGGNMVTQADGTILNLAHA